METYLFEIATSAGRSLLHPAALTVPLLAVILVTTGLAARVAVFFEDLRHAEED